MVNLSRPPISMRFQDYNRPLETSINFRNWVYGNWGIRTILLIIVM